MIVLVDTVRVLIVILCVECSARYIYWWIKVGRSDLLLGDLLLGIFFTKLSYVGFGILAVFMTIVYRAKDTVSSAFFVRLIFDAWLLLGATINLRVHWRIAHNWSGGRIAWELFARCATAFALGELVAQL